MTTEDPYVSGAVGDYWVTITAENGVDPSITVAHEVFLTIETCAVFVPATSPQEFTYYIGDPVTTYTATPPTISPLTSGCPLGVESYSVTRTDGAPIVSLAMTTSTNSTVFTYRTTDASTMGTARPAHLTTTVEGLAPDTIELNINRAGRPCQLTFSQPHAYEYIMGDPGIVQDLTPEVVNQPCDEAALGYQMSMVAGYTQPACLILDPTAKGFEVDADTCTEDDIGTYQFVVTVPDSMTGLTAAEHLVELTISRCTVALAFESAESSITQAVGEDVVIDLP